MICFFQACAVVAIVGGLHVGLANETNRFDAEDGDDDEDGLAIGWADLLLILTSPATLLLFYGVLMLMVTTFGCFAAAGGRAGLNVVVS